MATTIEDIFRRDYCPNRPSKFVRHLYAMALGVGTPIKDLLVDTSGLHNLGTKRFYIILLDEGQSLRKFVRDNTGGVFNKIVITNRMIQDFVTVKCYVEWLVTLRLNRTAK